MPSTAIDSQIHGCMFSTDEMRETLSDRAWAQKWLDTEPESYILVTRLRQRAV